MTQRNFLRLAQVSGAPAGTGHFVGVAIVSMLHQIENSAAAIAVVVVVGLPHRAKTIDAHFVRIAKVVGHRFEMAAVGIATKNHAVSIRLAGVVHHVAVQIHHGSAGRIVDRMPFIAKIPIQFSIGAEDEFMRAVVVLYAMPVFVNNASFLASRPSEPIVNCQMFGEQQTITRSPSTQTPMAESISRP